MIYLKNISKTYISKKKLVCNALENINLILPNSGLVFVIGKSGAGKSTLLNLIGGLDKCSSGEIFVNGNKISDFNERQMSNYRSSQVGFIFQDYHLIDELTIYENILLSINLIKEEDNGQIKDALEKVELRGFENKYPNELSGGERQRVGIARAIVKKPRIILADEPTGNLDNETATPIISLLKEISKECLIIIVSHNINDLYKNADRIIRLSKGNIIEDLSKKTNSIDEFVDTNNLYYGEEKTIIKRKEMSIKNIFKMSFNFLKSKIFRIFTSSVLVSIIMIIFSLSLTLVNFKSEEVISNELLKRDVDSFVIRKTLSSQEQKGLDNKYVVEVENGDYQTFNQLNASEHVYDILSYTLPIVYNENYFGFEKEDYNKIIFLKESLGTMIVDEQFFIDRYGKLEFVYKSDTISNYGVYITDYLADVILQNNTQYGTKKLKDVVGKYNYSGSYSISGYINGIIKTDYKQKHAELIKTIKKNGYNINKLLTSSEYLSYVSDVHDVLGYTYSFNSDFKQDFIGNNEIPAAIHHKLKINEKEVTYQSKSFVVYEPYFRLTGNNVYMNIERYNEIFGTNYSVSNMNGFQPHIITVGIYKHYDKDCLNPLDTIEVNIIGLKEYVVGTFEVSKDLFEKFNSCALYTKGFYFDKIKDVSEVIRLSNELHYNCYNVYVDELRKMTDVVDTFISIFEIIALGLSLAIVASLVSFSSKIIRDKYHDIGILKALGSNNWTMIVIFGIQVSLIAVLTIIISTVGYYYLVSYVNDILVNALLKFTSLTILSNLEFIVFKPLVVLISVILIIVLSLISLVIPFLRIRKIEPVKIIKVRE